MNTIKSVLNEVMNDFYTMNDLTEARTFITNHIRSSRINEYDKLSMVRTIESLDGIVPLQRYITNCYLKYEGNGVVLNR